MRKEIEEQLEQCGVTNAVACILVACPLKRIFGTEHFTVSEK